MQDQFDKLERRMDGLDTRINEVDTKYQLALQTNGYIQKSLEEIRAILDKKLVTQEEFKPVKAVVYGIVAIVVTAFLTAVVAIVIPKVR